MRATTKHQSEVWAFDVDGCLVDSLSGSSLRPLADDVLTALHAAGATLVLWSAGGQAHARAMATRHGFAHLLANGSLPDVFVNRSVCPSGSARAAAWCATMPEAPG